MTASLLQHEMLGRCLTRVDTVEKGIYKNLEATLIQDREPTRNLDSKIHFPGFVCFKIQFHISFAETFSTVSARRRPLIMSAIAPPSEHKRTCQRYHSIDVHDPELTYAGSNPTLHRAPDLILADAVCCRGVPGRQQMALGLSPSRSVRIASHLASPTTHLRCGSR